MSMNSRARSTRRRATVAIVAPAVCGLVAAACGPAVDDEPFRPLPSAEVLMEADRAFARDSRIRGARAWADVWAEDGRLESSTGAAVGPEAVRRAMAPTLERLGARFRWEPIESGMLWPDSLGYTVGRYRVEAEGGGEPDDAGRYLTVWRRTAAGWRVALDLPVPEAPPDAPGAREFDFWVGDWRIDQRIRVAADSFERYAARSRVRATADGGVLVESWRGRVRFTWAGMAESVPIRGASVRVHDPATGTWRIFWIDTLDPRFESPFEGRFTEGPSVVGSFERATEEGGRLRIRFRPRPDGSVLWDLAALESGEDPQTLWTMTFTRARVGTDRRVLFIGNSLTLRNDLPRMVEALAAEAGATVDARAVAGPGMSLEDHWNDGVASVIGRGGWDAVVLQQGPSTLPESRAHLRRWAGRLADTVRAAGAVPYLYMVWPPRDGDWDRGAGSYRQAAEAAGAGLLPVAEAFRAAWRRDPSLRLLGDDGVHPAPLGTWLAALVILAGLEGLDPADLPAGVPGHPPLDPAVATTLRAAAAEAIAAAGRDPG